MFFLFMFCSHRIATLPLVHEQILLKMLQIPKQSSKFVAVVRRRTEGLLAKTLNQCKFNDSRKSLRTFLLRSIGK